MAVRVIVLAPPFSNIEIKSWDRGRNQNQNPGHWSGT